MSILKYLETVSLIKSQEITFSFSYLNSLIMFSASSIVIGLCVKDALATILLKTPSSSLMLESILFAMFERIKSSMITPSSCAFFLKIARRVS